MNAPLNPLKIEKLLDAEEFLQLINSKRDLIIKSRIVLPKLGQRGLGKFKVIYKPNDFK